MSVNPVSQSNATAGALPVQNQAPPKSQPPAAAPQDTVQLSAHAKAAAAGDVDHDGDSH
jgi:PPE-repeat protein